MSRPLPPIVLSNTALGSSPRRQSPKKKSHRAPRTPQRGEDDVIDIDADDDPPAPGPLKRRKRPRDPTPAEEEEEEEEEEDDDEQPPKKKAKRQGKHSDAALREAYKLSLQPDAATRKTLSRSLLHQDHPDCTLTFRGFKDLLRAVIWSKGSDMNVRYVPPLTLGCPLTSLAARAMTSMRTSYNRIPDGCNGAAARTRALSA